MIDFDSDSSIESGITPAGAEAREAGGLWQVALPNGKFLAWVQHPLAGLTGKERAGAIDGIRGQWQGQLLAEEHKRNAKRKERRAALDLEADRKARDNVDAPIPNSGGIILPESVRSAVEQDTTRAAAPGPVDAPRTLVAVMSDDPLAYAKQQLTHAMKMSQAIEEKQAELDAESARWDKAVMKWSKMVKTLGEDDAD